MIIQLFFFDSYFSLPEGKSLSSATSIDQIIEFILKSFYQSLSLELSYKSLAVINVFSKINIDVEGQPFDFESYILCDEFIQHSISLFGTPDKNFAVLALKTLNSLVDLNEIHLNKCIEFGYLDHITEVFVFPDADEYDAKIEGMCLDAVTESIIPIIKFRSLTKCIPFIHQLSTDFIMSDNFRMNSSGLCILRNMIGYNFKLEMTEELFQKFLSFAESAPYYVLNELFALICNHNFPNIEEFSELLSENNVFLTLINRIETDSQLPTIIFRFLDKIEYNPSDNDPVIIKVLEILEGGSTLERIDAIRYLYSLTKKMPIEFCLFLCENGILQLLSILIDSKIDAMNDMIDMTSKIVNSVVATDADLMSFRGATEIYESLQNLSGEYDSFYDVVIERTIHQFPNEN